MPKPATENMKDMLRKMREHNGTLKRNGSPDYSYVMTASGISTIEHKRTAKGLISRKLVELKDGVYCLTTEGKDIEL